MMSINAQSKLGRTPVNHAAVKGERAVVATLAKLGASLGLRDGEGHTPLTNAARLGHQGVVAELVRWGANVNATDARRKTPLRYAAEHGRVEIVRGLLQAGAKKSMADSEGATPMDVAQQYEHADIVELLRNHEDGATTGDGGLWDYEDVVAPWDETESDDDDRGRGTYTGDDARNITGDRAVEAGAGADDVRAGVPSRPDERESERETGG